MKQEKPWLTDKYWVSHFNWEDEVRKGFTLPKKAVIHEVTIREAQQHAGVVLRKDEQLKIYEKLNEAGFERAEIWLASHEEDAEAGKEMAKMGLDTKVIACTPWTKEAIDLALECDIDGVFLECVANPWSTKAMWGMDEDEVVKKITDAAIYAKDHGLWVKACPWDSYRTPLSTLKHFAKSLTEEAHVDVLGYSDTFNQALPWAVTYVTRELKKVAGDTPLEMHCHNDFGLATANMLAAIVGGAAGVDTAINCCGERAGNASTEEVVVALEVLLGVPTGIKLDKLWELSQLVQQLTKMKVAPNKSVVGDAMFTYQSGMVIWMLEKLKAAGRETGFLPFKPELVGHPPYRYVFSKTSGKTLTERILKDHGIEATPEQIEEITKKAKWESAIRKSYVPEYVFMEIVREVIGK